MTTQQPMHYLFSDVTCLASASRHEGSRNVDGLRDRRNAHVNVYRYSNLEFFFSSVS